ncbi:MAG: tetratricopeptide repeat protein [Candidatus Polarisedimenticolaceae bacterium]|nr:tetratricopeptide repeat protein [Candidatus Polarisedimenticolaceae bacterium]
MSNSPDKLFKKASNKHKAGEHAAARLLYQRILKRHPEDVDTLYMLGTLYAEQGDLLKASRYLLQAANHAPRSPMIQNNLGNVYLQSGEYEEAVLCYQKTLMIDASMSQANYNLGQALMQLGRLSEALSYYQKTVTLQPHYFSAWFNLGKVEMALGQYDKAIAALRKALELQPDSSLILHSLGSALAVADQNDEAIRCYERLLELRPEDESAKHALAVLKGETTARAPQGHVASIFDELSTSFEQHLCELGYEIPALIYQSLIEQTSEDVQFKHMLDMGCGTGLAGPLFSKHAVQLDGVDLSPKMVELARAKEVYSQLETADLIGYLQQSEDKYDLLLATDVFVYLGDLHPVFKAVTESAQAGAWFLFSIELCEGDDYQLCATGRYAQSAAYIERLAKEFGFSIKAEQDVTVREEQGKAVPGKIYLLQLD